MADTQKDRVYKWEGEWPTWNRNTIGMGAIRKAIHASCDRFGIKPPIVKKSITSRWSFFWIDERGKNVIVMARQPGQLNLSIALHEVAHHIASTLLPSTIEDHGPEWMGIYVNLLLANGVASNRAIKLTLKAMKIKWYPIKKILKMSADHRSGEYGVAAKV